MRWTIAHLLLVTVYAAAVLGMSRASYLADSGSLAAWITGPEAMVIGCGAWALMALVLLRAIDSAYEDAKGRVAIESLVVMINRLVGASILAAIVFIVGMSCASTPQAAGSWAGLAWVAFATLLAGWQRPASVWGWCVFFGGMLGWLAAPVVHPNGATWVESAIDCGVLTCFSATVGMALMLSVPPLCRGVSQALEIHR